MEVRCKHCRKNLFNEASVELLTSHGEIKRSLMDVGCTTNNPEPCSYISIDRMPGWIEQVVNQESWTKGRLHCSHCNNRIGSFNFINVLRCDCNKFVTHPIRIINSKVDIVYDTK